MAGKGQVAVINREPVFTVGIVGLCKERMDPLFFGKSCHDLSVLFDRFLKRLHFQVKGAQVVQHGRGEKRGK